MTVKNIERQIFLLPRDTVSTNLQSGVYLWNIPSSTFCQVCVHERGREGGRERERFPSSQMQRGREGTGVISLLCPHQEGDSLTSIDLLSHLFSDGMQMDQTQGNL